MQEEKKSNRGRWVFRTIVVVLMVAIVILMLLQRCSSPVEESGLEASVKARLGQLENKSEAEIQAELNRVVEEGMFHISINARPIFEDGTAEGNLEIENVPNNLYTMRVEIALDDGQIVYDSGLVDPNYHIQRDNLNVVLEAGEYPATATFYAYNVDTLEEIGTMSTKITIFVKS